MVRKTLSTGREISVVLACLALSFHAARAQEPTGAAAVVDALLWGTPMAPAARTPGLAADVQRALGDYRERERSFRSALKAARNASPDEQELFAKRVKIERVVFCLFPRRDIARIAASYASDADVSDEWEGADGPRREAAFIDGLLRDLPEPWLAPYLNLIAGHRKLCASWLQGAGTQAQRDATAADARRQLMQARDGGHPIIRIAADQLLGDSAAGTTAARSCSPSP
jgi:hypothetical protein